MAAILPLAETVLLGGVDGALRAADAKAGRSTTFKQWSTWLELGLVGAAALAAMNHRVHADIWEPPLIGGLFALAQRGGVMVGHQLSPGTFGGPDGDGYGAPARALAPGRPAGIPSRAYRYVPPIGAPDPSRIQPAGILG